MDVGSLSNSTQSSVIYIAPSSPGRDLVNVTVSTQGGEVRKSISFDVVEPPSPTSVNTPILMDTPTTTPTPEPISCNNPAITKNAFPENEGISIKDRLHNIMIAICDDINYQRLWKIRHGYLFDSDADF